jgi:hypothetical protein
VFPAVGAEAAPMTDRNRCVLPRLAAAAVALGTAAALHAQVVRYVDDDVPPGGDGTSWNTAFRDPQDALLVANSTLVSEIHIAAGTYRPDRASGDRDATFAVECGPVTSSVTVWFQGGFAGRGAPNPDLRDPETFVTVLSGDLSGDDAPDGANAEWDAQSEGGGVWVDSSGATPGSLAASNCILWNNWATRVGTTEATQIAAAPADVVIDHSMVTGWTGVFGEEGNTGEEPRLVSPGGLDGMIGTIDDDPRLDAFSPCVDAGRNSALPTGITTDVLGHPRFVDDPAVPNTGGGPGPVSDMGAAERQVASCYADCNSDGVLNLSDFGCFQTRFAVGDPAADCNGDGVLGLADFGCFQTKFALGCP